MSNGKQKNSITQGTTAVGTEAPARETLDDYILSHIDPESNYLHNLWRATHVKTVHGRMASGHLQGRLLKMIVEMIRPKNILEVGTFSGYSALCMAEGLPPEGKLYTLEINDEMEDFARPWIEDSPYADKIEFIIGDANQLIPELGITFDMAFIDGDKRSYKETYEKCWPPYDPEALSLPTTRYGTDMSLTLPMMTTDKLWASEISMTS